jgi:hypothetical protein
MDEAIAVVSGPFGGFFPDTRDIYQWSPQLSLAGDQTGDHKIHTRIHK